MDSGSDFQNLFKSFWMGGFECADQMNAFGNRVDLCAMTGHINRAEEDYGKLAELGIFTVREGIRWSVAEKAPYQYDFGDVEKLINAAENCGIQIIWDICHFGFPDDLSPLHPMFARRFSAVCHAFVTFLNQRLPNREILIVPINEVSFVSWLGGDARGTVPYTINGGWDVKYHLMKAYIEAVRRLKEDFRQIKIITSEPLIHITTKNTADVGALLDATEAHNNQYQTLEILTGNICPELGGSPDLVDFIGVNFYFNNQWIHETQEFLPWADVPPNPYWKPLSELIRDVYLRYGKPIIITETGHPGEDRAKWLEMIRLETAKIRQDGIPLKGCCLYPVIDRPDWDFPENWHHSGIWDIHNLETLERVPHQPLLSVLETGRFS